MTDLFIALGEPRGADGAALQQVLSDIGEGSSASYATVTEAIAAVQQRAQPGDRIVIFGSFFTVAEAMVASGIQPPATLSLPCASPKTV